MDLRFIDAEPTSAERAAIDAVLGERAFEAGSRDPDTLERERSLARSDNSYRETRKIEASIADRSILGSSRLEAAARRRSLLLPALLGVQTRVGYVSAGALGEICKRLHVPPAEAYGVASFYSLISLDEQPPIVVHVCDDLSCRSAGSSRLIGELERSHGVEGSSGGGGLGAWRLSPCLGLCERAPAALAIKAGEAPIEEALAPVSIDQLMQALSGTILDDSAPIVLPQAGEPGLRLLRRVGKVDPSSLDDYRAHGGYAALRAAFDLGPDRVIREVSDSKLLGRGGAAFPSGRKWEAVAHARVRPHYLVCNADESEPGTFKDRVLMEHDPFAVIEAMTIAAFATGCELGYLYIRGEYPRAARRLEAAIGAARTRGYLGIDILERGYSFDIEIRRGGGAYICGEETALLNSIEGFRGEPRNKPPFPVQEGLFGKPTLINNVETLVNVLDIVLAGGSAYASIGTAGSKGTKLFCVSGRVERPGLYEVEFGATIRDVIRLAGGVSEGREVKAVLLGGAAGSFVAADELDTPLTFEGTRAIGASIGSGVLIVFDDEQDLKPYVTRIAEFFREESCGQCVPCRAGAVRQEELVARVFAGKPNGSIAAELALHGEIDRAMRDASICGLGQTAGVAIDSAFRKLKVHETINKQ
jgi:NADH-quinone oxidoreductase subunit F